MRVFDRIKELDEDQLADFLFSFAKDTLDQFARFTLPERKRIRCLLEMDTEEAAEHIN